MANIDGEWDVGIDTPMGAQRFLITVASAGGRFSGNITSDLGSLDFDDGEIDGDEVRWTMALKKPMPMKLKVRADVEGDRIQGTVSGFMGVMPLSGSRKSA